MQFKNVVVTGACGGLGQTLVRALFAQSACVALVGLQRPALETMAALSPYRCAVYTPDVSDTVAMQACAADWVERFGMPGNGAYCASKGGLMRYLESLRAELRGMGVRVHTISPGYLRTALTAGNRFAMPGLMEPDAAARALLQSVARGSEHIVLPRRMGWLARLLGYLPAALHDHILLGQPRKPRVGETGATAIPGLPPRKPSA